MREMSGMKLRAARGRNVGKITGFLECDSCEKRFTSGEVRLEARNITQALCNKCLRVGKKPLDTRIVEIMSPAHRRRTARPNNAPGS
jgi:hypothetical protein